MRLLHIFTLFGLGAAGVSGWYGFSVLRPKNLKQYLEWQGFKLVADSDVNTWTSILEGNKELAGKVLGKSDNPTIHDIKGWCNSVLPLDRYEDKREDASILCVNKPKTVKEAIIQQKGSVNHLISNDTNLQQYRVAYVFRKQITGFLELINFQPPAPAKKGEQPENENLEGGGKALKEWCESSLLKEPEESLVSTVQSLCTPKGFTSIKELLESNKDKLLTDSSYSEKLKEKYNEIKEKTTFKADMQGNSEQEEKRLSEWCTKNYEKHFYDEKVFSELYPKVRFRCVLDQG